MRGCSSFSPAFFGLSGLSSCQHPLYLGSMISLASVLQQSSLSCRHRSSSSWLYTAQLYGFFSLWIVIALAFDYYPPAQDNIQRIKQKRKLIPWGLEYRHIAEIKTEKNKFLVGLLTSLLCDFSSHNQNQPYQLSSGQLLIRCLVLWQFLAAGSLVRS